MKTAGIILDLYDNPADLRAIFPSVDVIPDSIKTAHALTLAEREALPDDAYALVLMNDGECLRKFACIDQGNTELSIAYFVKHGHKLPELAQKTAAANLLVACGWYNMEPPEELQKIALLGMLQTAITAPSIIKGTAGKVKSNLDAVHSAGGAILTPRQQDAMGAMAKGAEVSGTSLAPNQDEGDLTEAGARGKPGSSNTSAMKSAEALELGEAVAGTQYQKAPQMRVMNPHVDVTGQEPKRRSIEKKAEFYAYGDLYPLDSYSQVKTASEYFDEFHVRMPSDMKREFAVALVKRASPMGISISKYARAVASEGFAPEAQLRAGISNRIMVVDDAKHASVLTQLLEHRDELGPDMYCAALGEFDKIANIDHLYGNRLMDPVDSTFGLSKLAEDEAGAWTQGNDYVTKDQIKSYSVTAAETVRDDYGADFLKEFRKDPWAVFSSLPLEQKRRMARAASDNSPTGMHDVA